MLNLIIFAFVLAVFQVMGTFVTMSIFMSDWYLDKLMKKSMDLTDKMTKLIEEKELNDED